MVGRDEIQLTGNRGASPIFLNGEKIFRAAVKHGDRLVVGAVLVTVRREAPEPGAPVNERLSPLRRAAKF